VILVSREAGSLALPLLVARVGADDANDALALDDLALRADGFDAGADLHGIDSRTRVLGDDATDYRVSRAWTMNG